MLFYIGVVYASVVTVTALLLEAKLTAVFTEQGSCGFTVFAGIATVEAVAAVLTEMKIVIAVLDADGRSIGAIGIALTTVKAEAAGVADVHLAESVSAVGAEMIIPIGAFCAVFPAGAALSLGVILTAENTKSAIVAKLYSVLVKTFLALLTDHTAFLTVVKAEGTFLGGTVAVAALCAVHIFDPKAAFAEAAAVTEAAHTVGAEPAVAAKLLLRVDVTFTATEAVPAVIYVALLAGHTVEAKDGLAEAGSAFVTVGFHKAVRTGTFDTAGAAHSAAVFVPVIVVTVPAVHTVLVVGKDADDRGGNYAYEHYKRKKDSYDFFQNSVFHTSAPLSDGLTQAVRYGIMYYNTL